MGLLVLLAMLSGAALVLEASHLGPGLSPDSLTYALLARSLARGDGFRLLGAPETHFPPGYPAVLAALGATGPTLLGAARVLHALLFAINIALAAGLAARIAGPSAGALAALSIVGSPALLGVHAMLWSEPLFLALVLAGALLLGSDRRHLAAVPLALALLVRYAGLGFAPAAAAAILARGPNGLLSRVRAAALFAGAMLGPLAAWLVHNSLVAGSATERTPAWHPAGLTSAAALLRTQGELVGVGPNIVAGALVVSAIVAASLAVGRDADFALWATPSYLAFLFVSVSVLDADSPFDTRLLAPAYVFAVVLVTSAVLRLRNQQARVTCVCLLTALASWGLAGSSAEAARRSIEGEGFESRYWRESPALSGLDRRVSIASNGAEIVAFFGGGDVRSLPAHTSPNSLQPASNFADGMAQLCVAAQRGLDVLYLDGVTWRWDLPEQDFVRARCGLSIRRRFVDGVLLGRSGGSNTPLLSP
jgi:hypothetical protein